MAKDDPLLEELLKRPVDERARFAEALLESLETQPPDAATEAELIAEWVRRLESVEDGTAVTHDFHDAVARVRAKLRTNRRS